MAKAPGKREIKKMIAEQASWKHEDAQGRKWAIVDNALYCDNVWQSACADHEYLKSIATWTEN